MQKSQKIWMWIFLALFAVPEILWSPVMNFSYSILHGGNTPVILRNNFLMHSDYRSLAIAVIFLQSIGVLFLTILIFKSSLNLFVKLFVSLITFLLFILSLFVFILLAMTANM